MATRSAGLGAASRQFLEVCALIAAVSLLAAGHLAAVARPLFVVAALVLAVINIRRSPWQYLTFSLWIWTISPFVRRIVDYYGGFQPGSIILIAPNLLAVVMLGAVLTSKVLLQRRESAVGALVLGPALYGLAVSFFKGDIYPGIVAAIDWVIPLIYYFYIIHLIPRIDEAEDHFKYFVPLNLGIVAIYGIYQTFNAPDWDMEWVRNVKMFTMAGSGGLYSVKPFSMLSSPGTCAAWTSFGILLSLHFRNKLSFVVLPAALFFLILSQVRANLAAVLFGFAVAMFFGHRQILRSLGVMVAVLVVVVGTLSAANPKLADLLTQRFSTVENLDQDLSAQARTELYRQLPDLMAKYPLGLGIGAIGRGAVAGNNGNTDADFVSVDGGPIAIYLTLGWVAGTIYFGGMLVMIAVALLAAKMSRSPAALAFAITAMALGTTMAFTNLIGLQGLVIWLPAAFAVAIAASVQAKRSHADIRGPLPARGFQAPPVAQPNQRTA
jgi:hypothetical protein